jgi:hypothetical protein
MSAQKYPKRQLYRPDGTVFSIVDGFGWWCQYVICNIIHDPSKQKNQSIGQLDGDLVWVIRENKPVSKSSRPAVGFYETKV